MRREKLKVRVGKTYQEDNSYYNMMDNDFNFNKEKLNTSSGSPQAAKAKGKK